MDSRKIEVSKLSRQYEVRVLDDSDADTILELYKENLLFYEYTEVKPTIEQVADDMYVAPPGMTPSSKYYIGFYHNSELAAVMDLIDGYPKPETAYIGLFMVRMHWQGKQVGSAIIGEVEDCLKSLGIRSVRLAINKGNPQSTHFWKKNGYIIQREVYKEGWGPLLEAEKAISNACPKIQQMEIKMKYRIATIKDIPIMCRIRKQQLIDEGIEPDPNNDIDEELYRFFEEKLSDGSLVEWLLEKDGTVIATAAIVFMKFPPAYTNPTGIRGYITNMYTAPDYRRKGIAAEMLNKLTDEAKKRTVHKICLRASAFGKSVYRRFGFVESDVWMELDL